MVQTYVWNPSLQNGTSVAKKNSIGCNNSASNSSSMSGDVTTIRMDEGLLQNTTYNKSLLNNRECVEVMPSIFSSATIFPANDSKNHQSWLHSSKISLRQFPIVSSNSLQSCFQAPFVLQPSLFVPSNNWLLQPVNISGKLFFEPVGSFSIVQSINNPVQLSNASTIPTEAEKPLDNYQKPSSLSNEELSAVTKTRQSSANSTESSSVRRRSCSVSKIVRNTPPMDGDPPWVCGNPQPRCGIRGTRSWQMAQCNPALHPDIATQQRNHAALKTNMYQAVNSPWKSTVSMNYNNDNNLMDPDEQHKYDLLKQIQENERRKEEQRRKEIEEDRREEARFEAYRRKIQEQMEEEERKERKKRERAQEALRKADRIRAAHEELAGERRAARMKSHTSSSFESCDRLEWWEKKQPKSDNRFSSPVIPALRDRRDSNSSQRINNNEQIGLNFDSMNINSRPSSKLSDKSYEGPRKSNRKSNGDLKSLQPMSLQNKQRAKSGDNRNRLTNSDAGGYDSTFGNELEREAIKSRGFTVPKKP